MSNTVSETALINLNVLPQYRPRRTIYSFKDQRLVTISIYDPCRIFLQLDIYLKRILCIIVIISSIFLFFVRWTYGEFFDRYRMIIPSKMVDWEKFRDTCKYILEKYIQVCLHLHNLVSCISLKNIARNTFILFTGCVNLNWS